MFALDIADNCPHPHHIIIENIAGGDTEMGSSTAFSYPPAGSAVPKDSKQLYRFLQCIKAVYSSFQFSKQDQTLHYFLLGQKLFRLKE